MLGADMDCDTNLLGHILSLYFFKVLTTYSESEVNSISIVNIDNKSLSISFDKYYLDLTLL